MARRFDQALKANALPKRLGDVQLSYETTMWVGRADRPPRGQLANASLAVGAAFAVATLWALVSRADHATLGLFLLPCVLGFAAAAWLEQHERRQRAFAFDFDDHVLRLDFSAPISGIPRTLRLPFELVRAIELDAQGADLKVLTVDFAAGEALFREVLAANVTPQQVPDAERVRRMLRAAVGLERPDDETPKAAEPPPIVDTFG